MQAIRTHYIPPTDNRGGRVKATASAGSVTVQWDHAHGIEENHAAAALALVERYHWIGQYHGGSLPDGSMVWTMTGRASPAIERRDTERGIVASVDADT